MPSTLRRCSRWNARATVLERSPYTLSATTSHPRSRMRRCQVRMFSPRMTGGYRNGFHDFCQAGATVPDFLGAGGGRGHA